MADWSLSPYYSAAVNAAQSYGIPVDLFVAQIGQESSFNSNPSTGIPGGGIAQFKAATASMFGLSNRLDPVASLQAAAQYDAQLYGQTGSWADTLKRYGTTSGGAAPALHDMAQSLDNSGGFWNTMFGKILGYDPLTGKVDTPTSNVMNNYGAGATGVVGFLSFISDIPRLATTIVGGLMIAAGLFSLASKQNVISVITNKTGT